LFYVHANGDPIMAKDVITSSNPLVVAVWNEKFEKTSIAVNASQHMKNNQLERWCTFE